MANLAQLMATVNGASFIGIDTETAVKLKGGKKNEQQGRVSKRTTGSNVMVFQNKTKSAYGEMVKRRLLKEGKNPESFELKPRAWGQRLEGIPFVEHKGQYYLEVIFLRPGKSEYLLDGKVVDKSEIVGLEPPKEEAEQGGLDDKVIIRTYKVDSITALTINGQRHTDITCSF